MVFNQDKNDEKNEKDLFELPWSNGVAFVPLIHGFRRGVREEPL